MNMEHPGITIEQVLERAEASTIEALVGDSVVAALRSLDPGLCEAQSLREVAKRVIDPPEALSDSTRRYEILKALPLGKAHELGSRLGVELDTNLYQRLNDAASTPEVAKEIQRFFGAVPEERAPELTRPTVAEINAGYGLFKHQRHAAARVSSRLVNMPRKVVLHMPTGAGKTRTAMHVVARHLVNNGPSVVCWLAFSAELLEQAAEAFDEAWSHLGDRSVALVRMWGEREPDLWHVDDGIVIAGFSKLHAAGQRDRRVIHRLGDTASLTVVDEAHQVIAPTHRDLVQAITLKQPGNALLGLTATPGRTWAEIDADAELAEFFEHCKVTLQVDGYDDPVSYLIDQGYLAKPYFRTVSHEAPLSLEAKEAQRLEDGADYPESVVTRLSTDEDRNVAIIRVLEELMQRHTRILCFAASVEHAKLVAAILSARGHDASVVTGKTSGGTRKRLIRRFKSNNPAPMVLANYGVLTTGFDAPNTSAAVIARPTRSLVLYSQMVGRATRGPRAGGNETAEIVTVVDTNLPGFGSMVEAFHNWEDVWDERHC